MACSSLVKLNASSSQWMGQQGLGQRPGTLRFAPRRVSVIHASYTDELVQTVIRRQSTWELRIFKQRWEQAVKQEKDWVDPFQRRRRSKKRHNQRLNH